MRGLPIRTPKTSARVGLQLAMTHLPFKQALFGTEHLDAETWLHVVAAGVIVLLAVEVEKVFWRRRQAAAACLNGS